MDMVKLRAFWHSRLGVSGCEKRPPGEVFKRFGWARSVGGANPYLMLYSRADIGRDAADRAATNLELHELPAVRGCTYVVPSTDFAIALRLARGVGDPPDVATAKRHLGVTEAELFKLQEKVLQTLGHDPLDPKEIKDRVGDAVRSLGDEGKKRGMQSTLPMALGLLQTAGLIRRVPISGRLDQQRYKYVRWEPPPGPELSLAEAQVAFAKRYFEWMGVASRAAFRSVAGLGVKAADCLLSELGIGVDGEESDYVGSQEGWDAFRSFEISNEPRYAVVSNLDSISHLNWGVSALVDESDRDRPAFGPKGLGSLGGLTDLDNHAILDRGRLVGLWEFDPETGEIVAQTFVEGTEELREKIRRTERFIRDELGDMRSFSLDSPESRRPRIAALKA